MGSASSAIESCRNFDGFTAALGALTVDCLGTVGPNSFVIDKNGLLRRNFEKCQKSETLLKDIDDLLGVQLRENEESGATAGAVQCIAGVWQTWQKNFVAANIKVCPVWTKTGVVNAPTPRLIDAYAKTLPILPAKDDGKAPPDIKVNYNYTVKFPSTPPKDQKCQTPAECGQLCVGGFAGAWVSGKGETATLDPLFWLVETDYSSGTTNPFMRAGYYHKMSYYGADPGVIYGHRNRKDELCSRYYDGVHYLLKMEEECITSGDLQSCLSRCGSFAAVEAAAEGATP